MRFRSCKEEIEIYEKLFGKSFGIQSEIHVNISHLVCELNESENHHSTSFEKLWVVGGGGWVGGGCTVIITSALLLFFLN